MGPVLWPVAGESVLGGDPKIAAPILEQFKHRIVAQAILAGKPLKDLAVVAADAAVGGKPQMTPPVLQKVIDLVVAQPVFPW